MATGISVDQTLGRLSTWLSGAAFTGLVALAHLPGRQIDPPPAAPQHSAEVKTPAPAVVPPVSAEATVANADASSAQGPPPVPGPPRVMQPSSIASAPSAPPERVATPPATTAPSAQAPAAPVSSTAASPGNTQATATTPAAAPPNAPPPDTWSAEELNAGLRQCLELLAPAAVEMELEEPMRRGACGTPAPLALRSVGGVQKVEFSPPPTMNCRLAASLSTWVDKVLQPAAQQVFGSRVTRIVGASSYSCRNIYNNPKLTLSEHATGNAVDISAFVMADGRTVTVAKGWGPTERDITAARKKAAEKEAAKPKAPADGKGASEPPAGDKPAEGEAGKRANSKDGSVQKVDYRRPAAKPAAKDGAKPSEDPKGPAAANRAAAGGTDANLKPATTKEAVFLKRLHEGSCAVFATVLGPEANEAHRDHFHLDMKVRRSSRGICH